MAEVAATFACWPLLQMAPRGDGHPVLVLPGLGSDDNATHLLRHYLGSRGYDAHGWKQGTNWGIRPGLEARLEERLDYLAATSKGSVSVIGWSLGGVYARTLAVRRPSAVRCVITLGAPLNGSAAKRSLSVPTTSIFSRTDGIVSWRSSMQSREAATSENIEVHASHLGLGSHPSVLYAIANRLAQGPGEWRRFVAPRQLAEHFPDPHRP
ncbi:lipase family alpha/beta hydrolase [Variovorax sp.]|jgi:pimeloyl-ACP methyl ester carboxylesterase|uniref:lipase family alpha/beta hydrolase n=1 Tax=unclassified Variovorax TaxID=663243 RepID=UPI0025FB1DD5|nr:alpha/beta hydrolase [Variovorax sp.]